MLRTHSNSWMGSVQAIMTSSHNLCESQRCASACESITNLPALSVYYQFTSWSSLSYTFCSCLLSYSITAALVRAGMSVPWVTRKIKMPFQCHLWKQAFRLKRPWPLLWTSISITQMPQSGQLPKASGFTFPNGQNKNHKDDTGSTSYFFSRSPNPFSTLSVNVIPPIIRVKKWVER